MRIANIEAIKNLNIRKKLTVELVQGVMKDINAAGVIPPRDKHLGKAIMARINIFLMGDGCERLPLDLGD